MISQIPLLYEARRFLRLLTTRFATVRCALVAESLAFTTLLSLVPLLAVGLIVMRSMRVFDTLGNALRTFLLQNLLPDRAGKVIASYVLQFSQKASDLTLFGTLGLMISAVVLLFTIDRAFNAIWEIKRPRPWWNRLSIYWLAVTLGPLVLAASVAVTSYVVRVSVGAINELEGLQGFALRALALGLFTLFFSFLYFVVPNRRIVPWHAVAGGLFTAVGITMLQRLLGLYFAKFPSYTWVYGAFSAVPIFLVWLYTSWLVVLLGALICAVLPDFVAQRRFLPPTAAGRFYAALRLMGALSRAQQQAQACSLDQLAFASRQRIEEAECMLGRMAETGWVSKTAEGAWVLTGAAGAVDAAMLFERFVLTPDDLRRLSDNTPHEEREQMLAVAARIQAALAQG